MPTFKAAYLIHGDDHGRIAERRARLRSIAEQVSGSEGLEVLEGEDGTPDIAAATLDAMTLTLSRRFIIVDGVERWKDKDLDALEAALAQIAPETTISFFAREEGRFKAPERLHAAVKKAKGDIAAELTVKPWELPRWAVKQAEGMGLDLEPDAARALIGHVGERQQRLLRELEKLALGSDSQWTIVDVEMVAAATAASAELKAWSVADALVAGDGPAAVRAFLELRHQGERVPGLLYWISTRIRQALEIAIALDAGQAPATIKRSLRMPTKAADRLIADARRAGSDRLRTAVGAIADLELASRGGGAAGGVRNEDTAALLAIGAITA